MFARLFDCLLQVLFVWVVDVVEEVFVVLEGGERHDGDDVLVGRVVAEELVEAVVDAEQVVVDEALALARSLAHHVALRVGRPTGHRLVQAYAVEAQVHEVDEADAERREDVEQLAHEVASFKKTNAH